MSSAHPELVTLAERLVCVVKADKPTSDGETVAVPVSFYLDQAQLDAERAGLFRKLPVIAAHTSELAEPGDSMTMEVGGVSVLITRGEDGVLRGFRNACRHRGTRLLNCNTPCKQKAFVCPYHNWTYDLRGELIHVPHEYTFGELDRSSRGLSAVHVEERVGLIWVGLEPFDMQRYLGDIDGELASFGLAGQTMFRRSAAERRCNWKLVIDAFMESYHIRGLHRDSIYPFFMDARAVSDRVTPHVRAMAARRTLADVTDVPPSEWPDLRAVATPTYLLFPNTIVICHPDYTSWITVTPVAPNRTNYAHTMLIAEAPTTERARDHWNRSFELIDGSVFQGEDLYIAEQMQLGLEAGAGEDVLFGGLETPATWFHDDVNSYAPLRD